MVNDNIKMAVLGGDRRQIYALRALAEKGFHGYYSHSSSTVLVAIQSRERGAYSALLDVIDKDTSHLAIDLAYP